MFVQLESLLLSFAQSMPLPLFAGVASFLEEVIAPIPSGPVLFLIGSLASLQEYAFPFLFVLIAIASAGKLLGAILIYVVADKFEDYASPHLSRYLGVTHADIEKFGSRFGNGWKDYVLLTVLRAIPVIPSALISFGAGILRIPLRLFIFATFFGSLVRDGFFIVIGYLGLEAFGMVLAQFGEYELALKIVIGVLFLALLGGYLYTKLKR